MKRVAETLTLELERAALHAVRSSYENMNGQFFEWRLRRPSFLFVEPGGRLGSWNRRGRVLELSRALLLNHGWGVLMEVLKHEMAHQYVDEVLGIRDESSHGPTFRRVCEQRGFDARASGVPEQAPEAAQNAPILDRIAKLLALAGSPNEHEAQAAMSAAQRLMLKHNIDSLSASTCSRYTYRHLGEPSGRLSESQHLLASLLGQHFFVDVIWVPVWRPLKGKRGSVLEVCGTLENVELAAYAHAFLAHTAERLWREHKRAHATRSDSGRQSYLAGVMRGFWDKLQQERVKSASQGLVWVGDAQREQYFRKRHPRVRFNRHRSRSADEAYARGREAGRRIVLHQGIQSGSGSDRGRLLPPGSTG